MNPFLPFEIAVDIRRFGQVGKVERVHRRCRVGEVGVDLEAVHVANDQEWRVTQVLAVAAQLAIGGAKIAMLALVFPAEMIFEPDVSPAVAAAQRVDAFFEGVPGTFRIGGGGLWLAKQFAQVEEMLLGGAAFRQALRPT